MIFSRRKFSYMANPYRRIKNGVVLPLRHSLAGRILVGFIIMAFLSLIVSLAGIFYTSQANNKLVTLFVQDQQFTATVLTMERAAERQNSSVRAVLNRIDRADKELLTAIADYQQADEQLNLQISTLNILQAKSQAVKDRYTDFSESVNSIRSLNLDDYTRALTFLWENQGERSGPIKKERLINAIDDLLFTYREDSQLKINEARSQGLNVTVVAVLLVTVAGILVAFVSSLITRSITRPLRKLAGVARAIRQGDLDVLVPVMRGEDEVANLAGAMRSMAANLRISHRELQSSLEAISRRNRELSAVNRVAATTGQSLDLDIVLHDALDQIMSLAEMDNGSIFLMEPDKETLVLKAYHNQSESYVRNFNRIKLGEQLTGQVALTGEVTLLSDPFQDPRVTIDQVKAETHKRFYLGVPLKSKGKVVGVVNLTSLNRRELESQDLELLSAIGSQIGIAVDNARLYQQASQVAALEERNRLARDLHDSVTQTLFSITLTAESIKAMLTRKPERVEGQVDRLQTLARGALAEMRSLIFQLRPAALQEQGLVSALEKHIVALRTKEVFDIDLEVQGERRLSDDHEQALYRIAQEAFNNISKHAFASHVWVNLVIDDEGATLTIKDDGLGFDAVKVLANRDRSSLGLTSMRERTELAGGIFSIESTPSGGSTICVSLPLSIAPRPVGMGINN